MKTKGISSKAGNESFKFDYFTLQAIEHRQKLWCYTGKLQYDIWLPYINTSSLRWWSLSKHILEMLNTDMKEKEAGRREKVSHYPTKNPFNSRLLNFNHGNQFPSSPVAMCNENSTEVWSVFHFPSVCECLLVKDIRCEGTQLWESESESECVL